MDEPEARRSWHEPHPRFAMVLLRTGALGACFVLVAVSAMAQNVDVAVVVAIVAVALAFDLWRDLRSRQYVVAGPDLLVIRTPGGTSAVPWADVAGLGQRRTWLRRSRPVVVRRDGTTVDLPAHVPVHEVQRWLAESRGDA